MAGSTFLGAHSPDSGPPHCPESQAAKESQVGAHTARWSWSAGLREGTWDILCPGLRTHLPPNPLSSRAVDPLITLSPVPLLPVTAERADPEPRFGARCSGLQQRHWVGASREKERSPPPPSPSLRPSPAKFRTGGCQCPHAQPGSPRPQLPHRAAAVLSSHSRPAATSIFRDSAASSARVVRGNLFLNVPALSYHR